MRMERSGQSGSAGVFYLFPFNEIITLADTAMDVKKGVGSTQALIDWGLLILRVWLGSMMIYHGYGKVFGGMTRFSSSVVNIGMPAFLAWPAALAEFAGGILLILGLFTPLALFFIAATMAVAGFVRHASDPFGKKELALTYMMMALGLILTGPGAYSADAWLARRRRAAGNTNSL